MTWTRVLTPAIFPSSASGNMYEVPAMFDPILIVCIYAFKLFILYQWRGRVFSRPPFSRHQILARPVGHISPLIFEFQHWIATYEFP